jgi:Bacterial aa3 type cytochrome c oxidase subunit IV
MVSGKEKEMAATEIGASGALGYSDMDYPAHYRTYRLFTSLIKWGAAIVVCVILLLAFLTL